MDRRDFLKSMFATSVAIPFMLPGQQVAAERSKVPQRNRNPYAGIDWSKSHQIHTTTHGHCVNQGMLDRYLKRGFGLLALSNYYPSAPYYPCAKMTRNYYRVRQEHAVVVKGKLTPGPFDWNEIIGQWADTLEEKFRKTLPFKDGGPLFKALPEGMLEIPNAEHHGFGGSPTHLCSVGSLYSSGTFDRRDEYGTRKRGYSIGCRLPWRDAIDNMLAGLVLPDGGGVTINHPVWTRLKHEHMIAMLDHDPRVLGIEVFNQSAGNKKLYPWSDSYNEEHWDYALRTGRQCFGFFVPDWGFSEGVNVLLVPERTAEACLRAYRQGQWYGAIKGRGMLTFTNVSYADGTLAASTDKPARYQVISSKGIVEEKTGTSFQYKLPAGGEKEHVYLRLKAFATDASGEILYSQPFML